MQDKKTLEPKQKPPMPGKDTDSKGYFLKKQPVVSDASEEEEKALKSAKRILGDNISQDPEAALLAIEEKITAEPTNEEHYIIKFQILKKLNRGDDMLSTLETAANLSSNPYFPIKLAEYLEEHFAYDKAIKWREEAKQLAPNDLKNWRRLAFDYVRTENFEHAEKTYDLMIEMHPEQSIGHTFFQEMQGVGLSKERRKVLHNFGIKIALRYLALNTENVSILEGIALLARLLKNNDLSIEYYQKLLTVQEIDSHPNIRQWKTEVLKLYAREGYADKWSTLNGQLILDYEIYLTVNGSSDANSWLQLALQQIQAGIFEDAITSLKKCIEIDPKNIQALYELGRIYIRLDRSDEAIEYYKSILPSEDKLSDRMKYHRALELCLADLYYRLGRYEDAMELYKRDEISNYRYIAVICEARGDDSCLDYYQKAIDASTKDGRNYLALAEYYVRKNEWKQAEEFALKGLESPHITRDATEQLYVVLATAMMKTNRIKEALKVMDDAMEASVEIYSMELRKIKLLFMSGNNSEAKMNGDDLIKRIEKQLSCAPSASNMWTILGDLSSLLSQFDLARKAYRESMKYNALDSDAVRGEGVLCEKFGEIDKAIQLYKKYIMLEPLSLATPALKQKIEQLKTKKA